MREEQSDRILDLLQSSARVESAIETHIEEVVTGLDKAFAAVLEDWEEGQVKPDFQANLLAIQGKLSESREALSLAEQRHIDLIRQAVEQRSEREELVGSLYEDFSSLRRTVEELYRGKGKDNVNAFVVAGIQGPTAQKPTKLLRQIDLAIVHLQQPGLEFPASRFGETRLEPDKLVEVLKPRCDRLHQVQANLRQLASQMNFSRKVKNRAFDSHEEIFQWVARTVESYFHLAGEHELAERVRPSTRRSGRRAADTSGAPQGESEAGSSPAEDTQADDSAEETTSADPGTGGEPAGESESTSDEAPESTPSPPAGG